MAVVAVYSGADLSERVFAQALKRAREREDSLLPLVVRHQHVARQLGEHLGSEGFLGRAAVAELEDTLKAHRSQLVRRGLVSQAAKARSMGLVVEHQELKGALEHCIETALEGRPDSLVVISRDAPDVTLKCQLERV